MADYYVATTGNDTTGDGSSGNPYASPGKAASVMSGGDRMFIKSGTYSITSTTANVSGGRVNLASMHGSLAAPTVVEGYEVTPGDFGARPVLQASGIASVSLVTMASDRVILRNVEIDGASLTGIVGVTASSSNGGYIYRSKVSNCPGGGATCSTASGGNLPVVACEFAGNGTHGLLGNRFIFACYSHDNTGPGFRLSYGVCVSCISESNSGGTSDGFISTGGQSAHFVNCVAYNNGRDGFRQDGDSGCVLVNCIADSNGGYGFGDGGSELGAMIRLNCASRSNTSGETDYGVEVGDVTLTADPFTDAANGDFSLNDAAGGGAACKGAGFDAGSL